MEHEQTRYHIGLTVGDCLELGMTGFRIQCACKRVVEMTFDRARLSNGVRFEAIKNLAFVCSSCGSRAIEIGPIEREIKTLNGMVGAHRGENR